MSTESELELIFKILEEPNYTFLIFRWFKIEMPGTMSKFCKSIVCYVSWLKWFSELEWPIALFQRFTSLPLAGPTLVKTYQKAWNLTNTIRFQHHSNQPMGSLKFYKAWTLYHTTIWGLKQKLSIRTFRLHWAQKDVKTHHMEKKKTLLVDVHHYIQYKQSRVGSKRCTRHHLQRKLTVRGELQSMRVRWQWLGKGLLQAFSAGSRDLRPLLWDRGWSGLWAAQSQLFRSNRSDQEKERWGGALSSIWPIRKLQLDQ